MTTKSDISLDHYKEVLSAILDSPATIATNLKGTSDP